MELAELREEVVTDLAEELNIVEGSNFSRELLNVKVRQAIREVKSARNYPSSYPSEKIEEDMLQYYDNIRQIALYDYNLVGNEGQSSSAENGISRHYVDRNNLFRGITPIARVQ